MIARKKTGDRDPDQRDEQARVVEDAAVAFRREEPESVCRATTAKSIAASASSIVAGKRCLDLVGHGPARRHADAEVARGTCLRGSASTARASARRARSAPCMPRRARASPARRATTRPGRRAGPDPEEDAGSRPRAGSGRAAAADGRRSEASRASSSAGCRPLSDYSPPKVTGAKRSSVAGLGHVALASASGTPSAGLRVRVGHAGRKSMITCSPAW